LLSFYKTFRSGGREFFYQIFGENDLVKGVADNSIGGLLWIFLPIILVLLERDSPRSIFIKKGKKKGWIVGVSLLLILLAVASIIAWRSNTSLKVYLSLLPLGLTYAVLNSIKEEILYRGLLFGRTLKFGFGFSLVCQCLWFSLIHILYSGAEGKGFGMFFGVGVFAILAAWMTKKFDSLVCPVLVHTGIDLIIFVSTIPHNYSI
jgi:membrane protease YdiL (CAAX protease family)